MKDRRIAIGIGLVAVVIAGLVFWLPSRSPQREPTAPDTEELLRFHKEAQQSELFMVLTRHPKVNLGGHGATREHEQQVALIPGTWDSGDGATANVDSGREVLENLVRSTTDSGWEWRLEAFSRQPNQTGSQAATCDFLIKGTRRSLQQSVGGDSGKAAEGLTGAPQR